MRYLIVTADDFGFDKAINKGIAMAHKEGIVTSLSLMPTGEASGEAIRLAREMGLSEIGAHLCLTQTTPSLDPGKVPTLVTKYNRFYKDNTSLFLNLLLKRIDIAQAYLELRNQLDWLARSGMRITNLSSHENIHMIPDILNIFVRLAREYNIPAVRCLRKEHLPGPFSVRRLYKKIVITYFGKNMADVLKRSGIFTTDHFFGFLDAGNICEDTLLAVINSIGEGTTELVVHPGFLSPRLVDNHRFYLNCEAELAALTSRRVKRLVAEKGVRLAAYSDLSKR